MAYDICPVNFVMNPIAEKLGQPYDHGGQFARQGQINPELLDKLSQLEYYSAPAPKSLGAEWVWEIFYPVMQEVATSAHDQLRTLSDHFATEIANVLNHNSLQSCLVSGGGAFNSFLIENIQAKTNCTLHIPDKEIIESREALIFAFMGVLRMRGENNILSSVTGALADHCSGVVYGSSTIKYN